MRVGDRHALAFQRLRLASDGCYGFLEGDHCLFPVTQLLPVF
jgi:hypothetical protein